jgi:hypothetical protein
MWQEFWTGLSANVISDILLGAIIFLAVTQPGDKKKQKQRLASALGLLKLEMETNCDRANSYETNVNGREENLDELYPLRFTRGAWNALRESNFLPHLDDPFLVYHLLRMNEVTVVANNNLSKYRSALAKKEDATLLSERVKKDSHQLQKYIKPALHHLNKMNLPVLPQYIVDDMKVVVDEV